MLTARRSRVSSSALCFGAVVVLAALSLGCTHSFSNADYAWHHDQWTPPKVSMRNGPSDERVSQHVLELHNAMVSRELESDCELRVVRGNVRLHIGEKELVLLPGDIAQIPRDTPHVIETQGGSLTELRLELTPPMPQLDEPPALRPRGAETIDRLLLQPL